MRRSPIYGLIAEFDDPNKLIAAIHSVREEGYRRMDAFTPFPIEKLNEALGIRRSRMPLLVFLGGVLGCATGFFMQYFASTTAYPINVGGRPLNSWPAFIPVTFELTILFAALFAVLGMFGLNGLPMPHHPVFNVPSFKLATSDKFFLCVEAADPKFDREVTKKFLLDLHPLEVTEVGF